MNVCGREGDHWCECEVNTPHGVILKLTLFSYRYAATRTGRSYLIDLFILHNNDKFFAKEIIGAK